MPGRALNVRHGFASQTGKRPDNQDYVGLWSGRQVVAAIADGVGGHKGGRQAAETVVRGFLDAYLSQPETLGVQKASASALEPLNGWVHAQGRADPGSGPGQALPHKGGGVACGSAASTRIAERCCEAGRCHDLGMFAPPLWGREGGLFLETAVLDHLQVIPGVKPPCAAE